MNLKSILKISTKVLLVSSFVFTAFVQMAYADTVKPVITLVGSSNPSIPMSVAFVDTGATAADDEDGDITASIVIVNNVNMSAPGVYTVTYNVSDAAGNLADQVTRTVTVFDDIPPLIVINGNNPTVLRVGNLYVEKGVTAADNVDGDVSGDVVITGAVVITVPGVYTINYDVSDSQGNIATQRVRTVYVVDDAVSDWGSPTAGHIYAYDDTVTYDGEWQLPPEWVASIDMYIEKDGVVSLLKTIEIDSIGASDITTGIFSYDVSPALISGGYNTSISSSAAAACALDLPPTCGFDGGLEITYGYGSRSFTVGPAPDPLLSITPATNPSFNFLGAVVGGASTERSFFVENIGMQHAIGIVSIPGGSQYSCVSGCSYDLENGDPLHEVVIAFTPVDLTTNVAETITFPCDNILCDAETRNVVGTGSAAPFPPQLDYSIPDTDFGYVNIGNTRSQIVTISNIGGGVLSESITFSSPRYTCLPDCNYSVSSADSVDITIVFTPIAGELGINNAQMFIGPSETVSITGFANGGPLVSIFPTVVYDFERVNLDTTSSSLFVEVRNSGLGTLSGVVNDGGEFHCISNCLYANIAPGDPPHYAEIVFSPVGAPGLRNFTAEFTNDRVDITNNALLDLLGIANNDPMMAISCVLSGCNTSSYGQLKYNFGAVPVGISSGNKEAIVLTNTGLSTLSGTFDPNPSGAAEIADPWWEFVCMLGSCDFDIEPGESHSVILEFTPTYDSGGWVRRSFKINTNSAATSGYTRMRVYGTGIELKVTLGLRNGNSTTHTSANSDYGTAIVGGSAGSWGYHMTSSHGGYRAFVDVEPKVPVIGDAFWCRVNCAKFTGGTYSNTGEIKTRFSPPVGSSAGATSSILTFSWYFEDFPSINGVITHNVSGTVLDGPRFSFSGDNLTTVNKDFGIVNVGDSVSYTRGVRNTGIGTLVGAPDFAAMSATGQGVFECDMPLDDCSYSIYREGTESKYHWSTKRDIKIKFTPIIPLPAGGFYSEVLHFTGADGGDLNLTGIGNELPLLQVTPITPPPIDFGTLQTNEIGIVPTLVRNIGPGTLSGSVTFSPSTYYSCSGDCSYTLGPGVSKLINLKFQPTSTGVFPTTATYTNLTNLADPSAIRSVTGTGVFSSVLGVIGNTNFGTVKLGEYIEETFTIQNNSVNPISTGLFTFTNNTVFNCVDPSPCELNLASNESSEITVRFAPNLIGLNTSFMSLANYPVEQFILRGNGILPVKFEEI